MMPQLTSAALPERRWKMHQVVEAARSSGWKGFDDSLDDFDSRSFAYQCELIGQMVASGTLDYRRVRHFLQFSVVPDWNAFQPLDAHLTERYPGRTSPWDRFRELAGQVRVDLRGPEIRKSS